MTFFDQYLFLDELPLSVQNEERTSEHAARDILMVFVEENCRNQLTFNAGWMGPK